MKTRIHQISELGQAIWCDSISRPMIESGQLQSWIDAGVVGVTSNPTIFQKAISQGGAYDESIKSLSKQGLSAEEVYERLAFADIADAADILRPVFDETNGLDGFVSLEVNPHLAHDAQGTVKEAKRFFAELNRPNVFIKVPATDAGIEAIETLLGAGIHVNVTLIFSLAMYDKVMSAYLSGLEKARDNGHDPAKVRSVASFFVSRVDTLVDGLLKARIERGESELAALLGRAAVGNAKLAYRRFRAIFDGPRFRELKNRGAAVQRPLWASTSTKNPDYPDTLYVDTLIGPDTVNTLPPATIDCVLDHGLCDTTIERDVEEYEAALCRLSSAGFSMTEVCDELLRAGVKSFSDSFDQLISEIKAKAKALQTA